LATNVVLLGLVGAISVRVVFATKIRASVVLEKYTTRAPTVVV
jgi:hypothetical protein